MTEREIRASFEQAVGREVSTGWHTVKCDDCGGEGKVTTRTGWFDEVVATRTCFFCGGTGELEVADDPKWGWLLQMELEGKV